MPAIYLLRHGQASFGTDDYDVLSALGARQAEVAAQEFARRGVANPVVVSGTLKRQQDTAAIVARALGAELDESDARWNEMPAHGLVDAWLGGDGNSAGLTSAEFQVHLDAAMRSWIDSDAPDWRAFRDGTTQALTDLGRRVPSGRAAIVATSSGVTAAVCAALLGTGASGVIDLNRVSINASITTIAASERGLSLLSFNDHAHFLADRSLLTNR